MTRTIARVAVAAPIRDVLSYGVPDALVGMLAPGCQVLCPLGRRSVTGVVVSLGPDDGDAVPGGTRLRDLSALIDTQPMVVPGLVEVLVRAASYYRTSPGELVRAALPPGAAAEGARTLRLTGAGRDALDSRTTRDLLGQRQGKDASTALLMRLEGVRLPLKELPARKRTLLWPLVGQGLVEVVDEPMSAKVRPKLLRVVSVGDVPDDAARRLVRAPSQARLLAWLQEREEVAAADAGKAFDGAAAALRGLVRRGWIAVDEREVLREAHAEDPAVSAGSAGGRPDPSTMQLTDAQLSALALAGPVLERREHRAVLLFGVTGSGKTEVYLRAIEQAHQGGRGALVLVPEISLTPQLVSVFRARFGDRIAALHSGLSPGQRYDEHRRIRRGEASIVVGARSACFAPLADLGVVVIDEEHDASFKQEEGVRYDGREIAMARARRQGAVAFLGSATPRLETWQSALSGAFDLVRLPERATPRPLPDVQVVDMRRDDERPRRGAWLGPKMREALRAAVDQGGQAILFLNRRGFASVALCRACGASLGCDRCDVTLTFHRESERLVCHYCGDFRSLSPRCHNCRSGRPELLGVGTERVAAEVAELLPEARVARLDRDAASSRGLQNIIRQFRRGEADVLVGTQMVTKGHDFPRVTFVGVVAADMSLRIPDFRGAERTFQLLSQVAGRAGRGEAPGQVLVQAYLPEHPAIIAAAAHDFEAFATAELATRRSRGYPPFGRLAMVRLAGVDSAAVEQEATALVKQVSAAAGKGGVRVLGPAPAPITRIRNRFRWQVLLRADTRRELGPAVDSAAAVRPRQGVQIDVDVDPESML